MRKILTFLPAVIALALAVLSYKYLAFGLFFASLSRFYDLAPSVPEICTNVVTEAAVSFSATFDYVGLAVTLVFLLLAIGSALLAVRHYRRS